MRAIATVKSMATAAILFALSLEAGAVLVRGRVLSEEASLPIMPIAGAVVELRSSSGQLRRAMTDSLGKYTINVQPGRYFIAVRHHSYLPFNSSPVRLLVANVAGPSLDVRLLSAAVTTVLLLRHADRESDDRLNPAGQLRAQELVHVAQKARVTSIYATDTQRSRETVAPLAAELGIAPIIYASPDAVAAWVTALARSRPAGSTVLIAAHSDTLSAVITALGGDGDQCTLSGNEFDNLCVVSMPRHGPTRVLNLQYGAVSPTP